MGISVQFRRGTTTEWTAADPVLLAGEMGYDSTLNLIKIGDGATIWSELEYVETAGSDITALLSVPLSEDTTIKLDTLLSADEHWSGISELGTMGYAATVGDLMYLAVADSKWEKTKADVAATSCGKLGLCLGTVAENATCQVLLWGKMRSAAFPAAFTVGAPVYIDAANAGKVEVAAPTGTTGFIVRIIGYGNTAEDLYFCPDTNYLELA